mgnify:CR=1 FL=1
MNGIMKVVTLNDGRYIGLPKHIANIVEEAAKYRCTTEGDNIIKMDLITKDDFKRADCTTIRLRTAYDDQKWFRFPKLTTAECNDQFFSVGKQVIVKYNPADQSFILQGTGRDA